MQQLTTRSTDLQAKTIAVEGAEGELFQGELLGEQNGMLSTCAHTIMLFYILLAKVLMPAIQTLMHTHTASN